MEKEAGKRVDERSGLDIGETVEPIEKALNRLANRADERRKRVSRNKDIPFVFFPRGKKYHRMLALEQVSPGSIRIGFVAKQPALL